MSFANRRIRLVLVFSVLLGMIAFSLSSTRAWALPYYFDMAGGLSRLQKGSGFFGDSGADSADMGTSLNF
jgi:hypothetical protein